MVRTLWLALAALAVAVALTVGAPVASGAGNGGIGCPGQYDPYFLSGVDDPLASIDQNGNGYICSYLRKDLKKDPFIDDNNQPPKKVQ